MLKRIDPHELETTDGFEPVYFSASDGLRLYARDYGRQNATRFPERLPVICLPGFVRNSREFHGLAIHLSTAADAPRRVVSFDYRGRGRSEYGKPASYNLTTESEDVVAGMVALGLHRAAFVGASRGALIVHALAATRPTVIAAAVLNDTGPVIEGAGLVQMRAQLGRMSSASSFEQAADFLKSLRAASFPALRDDDWEACAHMLFRQQQGRLVANYDRALSRQLKDIDLNTPLPELWPQFDALAGVPIMAIRAEHSNFLSETTVREMARRHPGMTVVEAKGQGHTPLLHLDRLDAKIAAFLRANDPI